MASSLPLPLTQWSRAELLKERSSHVIIGRALKNALDLMTLGYVEEANCIISTLYTHNALQFENQKKQAMGMYSAWSQSNLWPSFILHPDPDKPEVICRLLHGGQKPEAGDLAWLEALESEFREQGWPKRLKEAWPKPDKADLEMALSALDNFDLKAYDDNRPVKAVLAAVETAFALGEHGQAEQLIRKYVAPKFRSLGDVNASDSLQDTESRQQISESRRTWELLCQKIVADELGVDEKMVEEYVDEGVEILQERFTKGPARPYANQSIPHLAKLLDESYLAARRAEPDAGEHMAIQDFDIANIPPSFLSQGASDEGIRELREKLGSNQISDESGNESENESSNKTPFVLPKDYEDFLRVSNGFYVTEPDDQTSIFYGSTAVGWDETIVDCGVKVELLPYMYTCIDLMDEFDWPSARAISLGAGGDEGAIWLLDHNAVREALEIFERVYEAAPESVKRIYERAARDLYGGIEEMRNLEWLVITWYHWNPDPEPYG